MKKLYILFLTFCTLFTPHSIHSQWVQQTLPVSGLVNDICFIDANTGFVSMDTPALLKTTNGGTNWSVIKTTLIYHIQFLDNLTGYAHGYVPSSHRLYKTTNTGNTWDSMFIGQGAYDDISFVNKDTGWIGGWDQSGHTIVWNTTNGGQTIQLQFTTPGPFINNIFFVKESFNGNYYGWYTGSGGLSYTTNSGANWTYYTNLPNQNAGNIFFLNKDTGWVSNFGGSLSQHYIMYTSNNGINWIEQNVPIDNGSGDIYFYNHFKGWGGAGFGKIYATTNAGTLWGYQNVPIPNAGEIFFVDDLTGWCGGNGICKTTNGGGNIIFNGIQQIGNETPTNFKLYQNYPNPFNSITNFKFQIPKSSYAKIIVFDVLGKVINVLVNDYFNIGTYKVDFEANNISSGIYFYRLITDNYIETKKMILTK